MFRKVSLGLCLLLLIGCAGKKKTVYSSIYTSNHDYVKLMKEVDVKTGEPLQSIYDHPQQLSPEQLKAWLETIYFEQYKWSSFGFDNKWIKDRVFESKAIDELAPQLVSAFSQAGSSDVIQFSISGRDGDNSGKMWIKDNQWVCELYQINGYGYQGKDSTRLDNYDWRLLELKGLNITHDRTSKCFIVAIDLNTDIQTLQQIQARAQIQADGASIVSSLPAAATSYSNKAYSAPPPDPQLHTTDQKMRLLRQWRDEGMITREQYKQKVDSLLKEF